MLRHKTTDENLSLSQIRLINKMVKKHLELGNAVKAQLWAMSKQNDFLYGRLFKSDKDLIYKIV